MRPQPTALLLLWTSALWLSLPAPAANAQGGSVSLDAVPVATAKDPDSLVTASQDSDSLVATSEDSDAMVATSEDPDSLVTAPEDPDSLVATGAADPTPAAPAPAAASPVLTAAQRRLEAANAAYSNMIARDYPRGDARAAIISERDAARDAYERARTASDAD